MALPPSPALSVCDSLAGIDDLDAFLDSQPALSNFPTPPVNERLAPCFATPDFKCSEVASEVDYFCAAKALAIDAVASGLPSPADVDAIYSVLRYVELPLELLAITLNILSASSFGQELPDHLSKEQPCCILNVIAALSLAVSYSVDQAPQSSWWAQCAGHKSLTAIDINRTQLAMYAALDWNVHRCTDTQAIGLAMEKLV